MVVRSTSYKRLKSYLSSYSARHLDHYRISIICLVLTSLLLALEVIFSQTSQSLLLLSLALSQLSLTIFILFLFVTSRLNGRGLEWKFRLLASLLNGCIILLFTGYIFIEIHLRLSQPPKIGSLMALAATLAGLVGNGIIFRLLVQTGLFRLRFGSFRLPAFAIFILLISLMITSVIIYFTDYHLIDTLLALAYGCTLFAWAGFTMVDAYWRILEIV